MKESNPQPFSWHDFQDHLSPWMPSSMCISNEIRTHTCTDFKSDASAYWATGTYVEEIGVEPIQPDLQSGTLPLSYSSRSDIARNRT